MLHGDFGVARNGVDDSGWGYDEGSYDRRTGLITFADRREVVPDFVVTEVIADSCTDDVQNTQKEPEYIPTPFAGGCIRYNQQDTLFGQKHRVNHVDDAIACFDVGDNHLHGVVQEDVAVLD